MDPRPDRRSRYVLVLVLVLTSACTAVKLVAGPEQSGRWTGSNDPNNHWSTVQIHLALLRGDTTYHSKILAWQEHAAMTVPFNGVLKGWNPPPDSAAQCLVYKASEFTGLDAGDPTGNIFCSGFSHLGSDTLIVVGGHEAEETGIVTTSIFTPNAATLWSTTGSMAARRWYPTITTLPNGKILATSGSEYLRALVLGGSTNPQSSAPDTEVYVHRMILTGAGGWDSRVIPSDQGPPTPREGHTLVSDEWLSNFILFGGRDTSTALKKDVWLLFSDDRVDAGEAYRWSLKTPTTTPAPAARRLHTAIVRADTADMFIFGGRDTTTALSDIWRVYPKNDGTSNWTWTQITPSGNTPGARYSHAAFYDPRARKMFVYGGLTTGDAPSDSEVWAYDFSANTWSKPQLVGSKRPRWREGHALVVDSPFHYKLGGPRGANSERAFLFGGATGSGLASDAWVLWVSEDASTVEWESLAVSTSPSARKRFGATYDYAVDRFVIFGGETGPTSSSSEAWGLTARKWISGTGSVATWASLASNPNASRAGCAMVHDHVAHYARYPEIYTAGGWTQMSNPKRQPWYPFMFVLPSGNVFYAGADDTTHLLNMTTQAWSTIDQGGLRHPGGSAVMYRPGKVMKCGTSQSGQSVTFTPSDMRRATSKIEFNASDGTSGWVYSDSLDSARVYHNLTILPNGKVLCTGGMSKDDMELAVGPVTGPRIWDADQGANGTWSGANVLASEPVRRNYHSTAMLLPDGRILSAGGNLLPEDSLVTIYCPPYLFNAGGLATRPTISSYPDTIGYGKTITVCTPQPDSITSACLIKPGAVTHGFNEDQRYVPLPVSATCSSGHLLLAAPANGNYAPPGDYLLFLVDNHGVPATAKWVVANSSGGLDDCDAIRPAQVSDLAVTTGKTSAAVTWTDVGDDSLCGVALINDIRYRTSAINESNFASSTVVSGVPSPGPPTTSHCIEISGLTKGTSYWFAIKVGDDRNNPSAIRVTSAQTKSSGGEATCGSSFTAGGDEYQFDLGVPQPNPAPGAMSFSYTMARAGLVSIRVFDVAGRLVRTLIETKAEAGPHSVTWDARDENGRRVRSGVYFYRMRAPEWTSERKVVFLEN